MIDLSTKHYVYIYAVLVLISVIYLYNYRKTLVKQTVERTKRNNAIEKFQSYTRAATSNINNKTARAAKEGFQSGTRLPSDSKSAALGSKCISDGQSSVVPDMQHIPDDEFYYLT